MKYQALLDGLEVSEVKLSQLKVIETFRIDSDYFLKKYITAYQIVENNKSQFLSFDDLGLKIDASAFYPSLEPYYNQGNVPFIRVADVNDFIDYENCVKIPRSILERSEFKTLKTILNGDIVITKGGSIGRVALITRETAVTRDLIFVNSSKLKETDFIFLYIYLNTSFCYNLMVQSSSMTAQPHLTLTLIKKLPIFNPNNEFRETVADLFRSAILARETAKEKYIEAEILLLENLGLRNFQATCEPVSIKSFKESFLQTGRLDAEYYQTKYEQYWNLIQSQDYVFIRDEYLHITQKPDWTKPMYQYIEIGDVNIGDGSYQTNWIETQELPANAKTQAQTGDILISTVRPYRGAVTIVGENDQDLVVSGAFTVLRRKENSVFNNEVLKVLLRSELYKDWLLQFNVGTSYPVIKDNDILNLPIPKISGKIQEKIADYIRQSNELRNQAHSLLAQAKNNVEFEIENNSFNINKLEVRGGG